MVATGGRNIADMYVNKKAAAAAQASSDLSKRKPRMTRLLTFNIVKNTLPEDAFKSRLNSKMFSPYRMALEKLLDAERGSVLKIKIEDAKHQWILCSGFRTVAKKAGWNVLFAIDQELGGVRWLLVQVLFDYKTDDKKPGKRSFV